MIDSHAFRFASSRSPRGFALVIVLAILVLAAGLVIGFLSLSGSRAIVSKASASGLATEDLARASADRVIEDLKAEIVDGSQTPATAENPVFYPLTRNSSVPVRIGTNDDLPNLVKRSASGLSFDGSSGPARASGVSTQTPSRNGRWISPARWNAPRLLASNATLAELPVPSSGNFTMPDWIYVTRNGTNPKGTTAAAAQQSGGSDPVIGRFAYLVYDQGGLLDINQAGYPSSLAAAEVGRKGHLALADLTRLGLTASQSQSLVNWRNASSAQNANRFLQTLANDPSAGLRVAEGDRAFLSRRQLLQFFKTQNLPASALPLLGTFTRGLDQPAHEPDLRYRLDNLNGGTRPKVKGSAADPRGSVLNNGGNLAAGLDGEFNPAFLAVRVINPFTRLDGTTALVGEPLVKSRFPLERLAWLTADGPSASLSTSDSRHDPDGTSANILKAFGLEWVDGGSGYNVWRYNHGDATRILRLAEIANLPGSNAREPDFFELLQAAIHLGSLGRSFVDAPSSNFGVYRTEERNFRSGATSALRAADPKYQILQIGAAIIDQADPDSYPTEIQITGAGSPFYGVENLPYLNRVIQFPYIRSAPSGADRGRLGTYLLPQLWNPHDQTLGATTPAPPSSFRIELIPPSADPGGIMRWWTGPPNPPGFPTGWVTIDRSGNGTLGIEFTAAAGSYSEPRVLSSGSLSPAPPSSIPGVDYPGAIVTDLWEFSSLGNATIRLTKAWPGIAQSWPQAISAFYPQGSTTNTTFSNVREFQVNGTNNLRLAYQRPGGGPWRIYCAAREWLTNNTPLVVANGGNFSYVLMQSAWDPRSDRFPPDRSSGNYPPNPHASESQRPGADAGRSWKILPDPPVAPAGVSGINTSNGTAYLGLSSLNQNRIVAPSASAFYYQDPDGVVRGGDGMYEVAGSTEGQVQAILAPRNPARPIILNRPFRSVGELGYAFRGAPWKSLDFFSGNSGDAALLDVFCIREPAPGALRAGVVNLNTRNPLVLEAMMSGALKDETPLSGTTPGTPPLSSAQVQTLANSLVNLTKSSPLAAPGELVTNFVGDPANFPLVPGSDDAAVVKRRREAIVRVLADVGTTRVWNLFIDVIAQTGRIPLGATRLGEDFVMESERRYWVHVAIDRATGQVIDRQTEAILE